ncbi:MAG TPA: trypsin-like peptidase domain-containing protein [Wenzhouxiangellaceae bacterium]|nr:trypsin-like peptidase domain-containing protein [Wenzhouxiangellaceae bacterium]
MKRIFQFLLQFTVLGLAFAFVLVWFQPGLLTVGGVAGDAPAVRSYADAVNRTAPSVVSIYTRTMVSEPMLGEGADLLFQTLYRDRRVLRPRNGLGSGVIVSAEGLILTTAHVINGVDNIFVALFDGSVAEARVIGTDPGTDLAVLKVDLDELPVASFDTETLHRPGDVVLAIGNAFGLNHTVTAGIISATGRGDLNLTAFEDFIQTDAAINSGNSGGALINIDGEVIGINSASLSQETGAQGISFAISARLATEVLRQIVEYGSVRRGWIGANVVDPPLVMLEGEDQPVGVQIAQIYRGGPAWQAGLRPGDTLLSADGAPIGTAREFTLAVAEQPPGSEIELVASRNGQQFTTSVTLIQQPPLQG